MINMSFHDSEFTIIKVWAYMLPFNSFVVVILKLLLFLLKKHAHYVCHLNLIKKLN